jgi:hypothetical protein
MPTFCATANVVMHLGARPVLVDIGSDFAIATAAVSRSSRFPPSLSPGTTGWQESSIDFDAGNTSAVTINIQRQVCASNPCPIVGRAWFDSFSLKRLQMDESMK